MKTKNFLVDFNECLLSLLKENKNNESVLSIQEICKKTSNLSLFPKDNKDIDELIDTLLEALDTLNDIFSKPHIQTTTTEYVSRSELVTQINNDDFIKTLKEPGFWKQKSGEMVPEYIYSKEYIDTIRNYDNYFVIFVFKEIMELIKNFNELQITNNNSIQSYFETSEVTVSKLSIFSQIDKEIDNLTEFIYKSSTNNKNYEKLVKIHKKLVRLKANKFYQELKESFIKLPISMTNIILHDKRYNYLYRFYKNYLFNKETLEDIENLYFNYVCVRFISYLYPHNKNSLKNLKFVMNKDKDTFENKEFSVELNDQIHSISFNSELRTIEIVTNYNGSLLKTAIQTKYIINKDDVLENVKDFDNTFFITFSNLSKKNDRIGVISHFKTMNADLEFENIFKSLHIILDFPNDNFVDKCPICGSHNLNLNNKNINCLECRGLYSIIDTPNGKKIWIKNLWRN